MLGRLLMQLRSNIRDGEMGLTMSLRAGYSSKDVSRQKHYMDLAIQPIVIMYFNMTREEFRRVPER